LSGPNHKAPGFAGGYLLYGFAGVVSSDPVIVAPGLGKNICGNEGVPLTLAEWIFSISNNIQQTILWTPRHEESSRQQWFTARPFRDFEFNDPNGNYPVKKIFQASGTSYTTYQLIPQS
jgi:hypothetical protein